MTIGEKIKKARKAAKKSQSEIAELSGLHVNTISRYENDDRTPTMPALLKIASAIGIDAACLFDESDKLDIFRETLKHVDTTAEKTALLLASDKELIKYCNKLNMTGKRKVIQYAIDLSKIPEYTDWDYDLEHIETDDDRIIKEIKSLP